MSRNKIVKEKAVKRCKEVTKKARHVAHNALRKIRNTEFTKMIHQNTSKRLKWVKNNNLAIQTGVAVCASAIVGIFTGGIVIEAFRAGASVLVSNAVSNAVFRNAKKERTRRRKERMRSMDEIMESAKRNNGHVFL